MGAGDSGPPVGWQAVYQLGYLIVPSTRFSFPLSQLTQMTLETKGVKVAEPPNAKDQESEISSGGKWPPAQTKTPPFQEFMKTENP